MPKVRPKHGPSVGPSRHEHDSSRAEPARARLQSGRAVLGPGQTAVLWAGPWATGHMAIYSDIISFYAYRLKGFIKKIKKIVKIDQYMIYLFANMRSKIRLIQFLKKQIWP